MYSVDQIKILEIELSSNCQASCPFCLRNFNGASYNKGYTVRSLSINEVKQILPVSFIQQLDTVIFEGNLGDAIVAPDLVPVVQYLRENSSKLEIEIHTNASAGLQKTWESLADARCKVFFALDGLADTHSLHRRGTDWHKIIRNAKWFIERGGGIAIWKYIPLSINEHQQEQCRELSEQMGFDHFAVMSDQRQNSPVFNKQGEYQYSIGKENGPVDFTQRLEWYKSQGHAQNDRQLPKRIQCYAIDRKYLYLDALGDVYPCCYLGAQPKTFDRQGGVMQHVHERVSALMYNNNLFENTLEEATEWFNDIPPCWSSSMDKRLQVCDNVCGKNTNFIQID